VSTAKPVVKILPLILLVLIPIWFFINPKAETENNILNPIGEFVDSAQKAMPGGKNVQTENTENLAEIPESESGIETEKEIYIGIEEIESVEVEENIKQDENVEEEKEIYIELENITNGIDDVEINKSILEKVEESFEESYENSTYIPLEEIISYSENDSLNLDENHTDETSNVEVSTNIKDNNKNK